MGGDTNLRAKTRSEMTSTTSFSYEGNAFSFAGKPGEHVLGVMRSTGTFYESDVLEFLRERLSRRSAGLIVDAGAFIGTHAVYFASMCPSTEVWAFEPNPDSVAYLKANIEVNRAAVRVLPKALGSRVTRAEVRSEIETNTGMASLEYEAAGPVEVTTLDSELSDRDVSLIKIDVEGFELEVLRGAVKTIDRSRPILCIEAHSPIRLATILLSLRRYRVMTRAGHSPTYILEPDSSFARHAVNAWWVIRPLLRAIRRFVGK